MSSFRRTFPLAVAGVLLGLSTAQAQTSALAPPPNPPAIPERIDPIVTPLPPPKPAAVGPVGRTPVARAGAKTTANKLACPPGERVQRKTGLCQPLINTAKPGAKVPVAGKPPAPAKPAATGGKTAKPKSSASKSPAKKG